jgi:hypothetical protein
MRDSIGLSIREDWVIVAAMGWYSIESAPRDGTWVIIFGEWNGQPRAHAAFYSDGDWYDSEAASASLTTFGWRPTGWTGLPK